MADGPVDLVDERPHCHPRGRWAAAPRALATYSAGDHVRHAKFGEGIVIMAASTANSADQEDTVAFNGESGVKKLRCRSRC